MPRLPYASLAAVLPVLEHLCIAPFCLQAHNAHLCIAHFCLNEHNAHLCIAHFCLNEHNAHLCIAHFCLNEHNAHRQRGPGPLRSSSSLAPCILVNATCLQRCLWEKWVRVWVVHDAHNRCELGAGAVDHFVGRKEPQSLLVAEPQPVQLHTQPTQQMRVKPPMPAPCVLNAHTRMHMCVQE